MEKELVLDRPGRAALALALLDLRRSPDPYVMERMPIWLDRLAVPSDATECRCDAELILQTEAVFARVMREYGWHLPANAWSSAVPAGLAAGWGSGINVAALLEARLRAWAGPGRAVTSWSAVIRV